MRRGWSEGHGDSEKEIGLASISCFHDASPQSPRQGMPDDSMGVASGDVHRYLTLPDLT